MATLVHRLAKVAFFLLLLVVIGRSMGLPYNWLNHDFVLKVGILIYGPGEIGAEAIDDTYFYIHFIIVMIITIFIYFITMKLIRKIRTK
ncbi:hypothetical protein COO59_06395 [Mixta theicola]|uniref:Uncharacterized protein n=1 Tax=Mixta theicola TaxID=1458355 RepID=A0A2K1QCH6_9GAMM|nr:hypothetical protein COO59_06395 [Mixta theicola]GLR10319.1 hypothetical protein GCM10007905_30390 [Mixta theicola]